MGSFLLPAILSVIFTSSTVFAEAKQSSITMSTTTSSLSAVLGPTMSGNFGKSNSSTIRISTDNSSGYTLRIFSNEDASLSNGTSKKIESISGPISEEVFSTNINHNNKWGYRPSKLVSYENGISVVNSNSNFLPAPGSLGDILDITNTSNNEDKIYTLDFGAKIDYNMPTGTYSNSLTLIALANNIEYTINYDKNTTDEVNNMPSPNPQVVTIEGGAPLADSDTRISSTTPTREGFKFYGWCDEATESDSEGYQTCPGYLYEAGNYYGIDQTANSSVNLYAVWVKPISNITLKHNCPGHSTGSTSTTAEYGSDTLDTIEVPTCTDYNFPFYFSFVIDEGASVTPSSDCAPGNCVSTKPVSFSFAGWYDNPSLIHYDFDDVPHEVLVASTDTTPVLQPFTDYADPSGRWRAYDDVELYAGWYTSVGSYQSKTLPTITKDGYVCGWKDPSGRSYNSGASIMPDRNYYDGMTFRGVCSEKIYMQDVFFDQLSSLVPNEGDSIKLADKRDESDYNVTRINGIYWMTQNLRITGTISADESNFNSGSVNVCEGDLTAGDSYNEARCHDSSNDNNGVWYNFAAASAKTIVGSDNSNDATEDICPAGWHLPDFDTLYNKMGDSSSYNRYFSPVSGGYYYYGSLRYPQEGRWWSATAEFGSSRYGLQVRSSSYYDGDRYIYEYDYEEGDFSSSDGNYIRCVKTSDD